MTNSNFKWEFYRDNAGLWRWRKISTGNYKIVGASSESFSSRYYAIQNAKLMGYVG